MSVCAFILCLLSCVWVAALRRADHPSKESYHLCKKDYETEEEVRAKKRAVEPLMNERLNSPQILISFRLNTLLVFCT
jgi:hypothetical protein